MPGICNACSTDERNVLDNFDEIKCHALTHHPDMLSVRRLSTPLKSLSQRAKSCIFVSLEELFTDASLIRETANYMSLPA